MIIGSYFITAQLALLAIKKPQKNNQDPEILFIFLFVPNLWPANRFQTLQFLLRTCQRLPRVTPSGRPVLVSRTEIIYYKSTSVQLRRLSLFSYPLGRFLSPLFS